MGLIVSRFRTKKGTIEILEDIDKDINKLQKNRKQNQERQKKIVTSLLIYSIAAYVLAAIIFFVYYFPDTWSLRFLYSLPLLVFPFLIWGLKKLLHWYFVKRIASNDVALLKLREQKKQILEDVMETETYKKAKEILEKFDPVRFKKLEAISPANTPQPGMSGTQGTSLHHRPTPARVQESRAVPQTPSTRQQALTTPARGASSSQMVPQPRPRPTPTSTPGLPPRQPMGRGQGSNGRPPSQMTPGRQEQQQQGAGPMAVTPVMPRGYAMPPGPPMPRSVLPQNRGTMDRLMDYLVGDGPENRYALICRQCHSHNGMALKEEFEYLTFRCCYCYQVNPARKQRPLAPKLEFFAPRGFNTDSQGSAVSEDDSDDDDDDDDEDATGDSKSSVTKQAPGNKTPAATNKPLSKPADKTALSGKAVSATGVMVSSSAPKSATDQQVRSTSSLTAEKNQSNNSAAVLSGRQAKIHPSRIPTGGQVQVSVAPNVGTTSSVKSIEAREVGRDFCKESATSKDLELKKLNNDKSSVLSAYLGALNGETMEKCDTGVESGHDTVDTVGSAPTEDEVESQSVVNDLVDDVMTSGDFTTEDVSQYYNEPGDITPCSTDCSNTCTPPAFGQKQGEHTGLTLSGEIRGSIKSLLSPTDGNSEN